MVLSSNCRMNRFEEGSALFNIFTGDTHFIPQPFNEIINTLIESPSTKEVLLNSFIERNSISERNTQIEAEVQFNQFITEALNSDIISE